MVRRAERTKHDTIRIRVRYPVADVPERSYRMKTELTTGILRLREDEDERRQRPNDTAVLNHSNPSTRYSHRGSDTRDIFDKSISKITRRGPVAAPGRRAGNSDPRGLFERPVSGPPLAAPRARSCGAGGRGGAWSRALAPSGVRSARRRSARYRKQRRPSPPRHLHGTLSRYRYRGSRRLPEPTQWQLSPSHHAPHSFFAPLFLGPSPETAPGAAIPLAPGGT